MRYIRDIIKDKQKGTDAAPAALGTKKPEDEFSTPLLLVEPIFPDDAVADVGGEVPEPKQSEDDQVQHDPSDIASDVIPGAAIPVKEPLAPRPAQVDTKAPENEEAPAMTGESEADPFDKLRHSADQPRDKSASVSPLRAARPPASSQRPEEDDSLSTSEVSGATATEELTPLVDALDPDKTQMPAPAQGRGSKVSGRVKTRLLGFSAEAFDVEDPFKTAAAASNDFPVGWLVVVSEKGRGKSYALRDGVSSVGRGSDQTVCLDFGDNSISRENHISIAFDAEQQKFFVGHGGKTNLVRLNNAPLLSTETLKSKDMIRLGETTLRFMAFCDDDFSWEDPNKQKVNRA